MVRGFLGIFPLLLLLFQCLPSYADNSRPLVIELKQNDSERFTLVWKMPPIANEAVTPTVALPSICTLSGPTLKHTSSDGYWREASYHCHGSFRNRYLTIDYPRSNPALPTFFRTKWLDGAVQANMIPAGTNSISLPIWGESRSLAVDYLSLGVEHILAGLDHLLFVACLIWIAKSFKRIFITISGFTVAHSVTLVISSFEWFTLPIAPVEATIALSVVFLASEAIKANESTLCYRHPFVVSSLFGLLHGFGFASALSEIGLPANNKIVALLFFNVGVEVGQVIFALSLISAGFVLKRLLHKIGDITDREEKIYALVASKGVLYMIGTTAMLWTLDRTSELIG